MWKTNDFLIWFALFNQHLQFFSSRKLTGLLHVFHFHIPTNFIGPRKGRADLSVKFGLLNFWWLNLTTVLLRRRFCLAAFPNPSEESQVGKIIFVLKSSCSNSSIQVMPSAFIYFRLCLEKKKNNNIIIKIERSYGVSQESTIWLVGIR